MAGTNLELHQYQIDACREMTDYCNGIAVMPMGAGKTITTLSSIASNMFKGSIDRAIIFAPKLVAEEVWTSECDASKWSQLRHLSIATIAGVTNIKKRMEIVNKFNSDEINVLVCNYELGPWLKNYVDLTHRDAVYFDEVTRMKSHKGRRRKDIMKTTASCDTRWGLTGSPMPNSAIDCWGMMDAVSPGEFGGFYQWRASHFRAVDRNGYIWKEFPGMADKIKDDFSDVSFRTDPADIPASPIPQVIEHPFTLPPKLMRQYKELEDEMVLAMGDDPLEWITAENDMAQSMKLRQFGSGFVYDDDRAPVHIHDLKMDVVREIVEAAAGESLLILYQFKHEADMLTEVFPDAINLTGCKDIKSVIEAWNRGEVTELIGHPASMGHGLNLQHGGHHILWFSVSWSLEHWEQANARLARQGQKNQVYVHVPLVKGSLEADMFKALHIKAREQDELKSRIAFAGNV